MSGGEIQPDNQDCGQTSPIVFVYGASFDDILADAAEGLQRVGLPSMEYSTRRGPCFDLADDAVWQPLFSDISSGKFSGLLTLLPNDTFQNENGSSAVMPMRGQSGSTRYGLREVEQKFKTLLRLHNLYLQRIVGTTKHLIGQGAAIACVASSRRKGSIYAFFLLNT